MKLNTHEERNRGPMTINISWRIILRKIFSQVTDKIKHKFRNSGIMTNYLLKLMTEKKGYAVSYYEEIEMYDVSWSLNKIQVSNVITYVHLTY